MKAKGEGSVTYLPASGRWLVKVPIGRYRSGGTQYKSKYAKTVTDGNRIRIQLLSERQGGRLIAGPKETFKVYADWYYQNEAGNTMRETTIYQQYQLLNRYAFPTLGHRPIVDLTPREITNWMQQLRNSYSVSTVNNTRAAMSGVFSSAVRNEKIPHNTVAKTQKLKRGQFEKTQVRSPYDKAEALKLLEAAKESDLDAFIHLAVFTGMRRGEILGLKWSDIEFEQGTVYIERTLKEGTRFVPGGSGITQPVFNEPKTASSKRLVHLAPAALAALTRHQLIQGLQKSSLEGDWFENDLIFTGPCGTAVWPSNYWYKFRKFLDANDFRRIRIHDLRHTFAMLALESGVQLAAITQTLGHSGIEITKNIYAKQVPALEVEATTAIAKLLDPTGPAPIRPSRPIRGIPVAAYRPNWNAS